MKVNKRVSSSVLTAAILASVAAPSIVHAASVTVKSGDTLSKIAQANQTTVDNLIKQNKLPTQI